MFSRDMPATPLGKLLYRICPVFLTFLYFETTAFSKLLNSWGRITNHPLVRYSTLIQSFNLSLLTAFDPHGKEILQSIIVAFQACLLVNWLNNNSNNNNNTTFPCIPERSINNIWSVPLAYIRNTPRVNLLVKCDTSFENQKRRTGIKIHPMSPLKKILSKNNSMALNNTQYFILKRYFLFSINIFIHFAFHLPKLINGRFYQRNFLTKKR